MLLRRHYAASVVTWCRCVVVITTAQLHWTRPESRFFAGSNLVRDVSEIRDGEDLLQWFQLEIKLNSFLYQPYHKTIHHHHHRECYGLERAFFTLGCVLHCPPSCFWRLPWGRQFNLKVTRTSCWSLKHSPGPTICLCHNKLQKIYTW